MTATKRSFCIVCQDTMGYLWTGIRTKFPHYACGKCYAAYFIGADGLPIPHAALPKWLKYLHTQESLRRQRLARDKKRGFETEPIPVSGLSLAIVRRDHFSDADYLETLGVAIGGHDYDVIAVDGTPSNDLDDPGEEFT